MWGCGGSLRDLTGVVADIAGDCLLPTTLQRIYTSHREQLIRASGFVVFVCGNRVAGGKLELSPGVMEEFGLATTLGRVPIPIGATGWAASQVLAEVRADLERYYGEADVVRELNVLNDAGSTDRELLDSIFSIIAKVRA
jgi:hypothetical protein